MKNLWSLDFMGFTEVFHLLSHSIFLILHHFYTISFDFGVTLIFFTPNYTIDLHLHHSRYSFRQIHFWHLIFYMRHFCDMIVDIHSDLRIRVVFAPLRSVLNGCPPDIQHPITYCITLGFLMIFWKNGHLEKKNWNLVRLAEMNILNGKSTGRRPVMIVENENHKRNGKISIFEFKFSFEQNLKKHLRH